MFALFVVALLTLALFALVLFALGSVVVVCLSFTFFGVNIIIASDVSPFAICVIV